MFHRLVRARLIAAASIAVTATAWCPSALAAGPVRIRTFSGGVIVCDTDTTPATYDGGATASSKILYLAVGNNSDSKITNVVVTLTGAHVPGVFSVYYSQVPGTMAANKGYIYYINFQPPAADPSGTTYGGSAANAMMRVTYNIKPKKGKVQTGTPLELILTGRKL